MVESKDGAEKKKEEVKGKKEEVKGKKEEVKGKKKDEPEELSEEDQEKKEQLEMLVERAMDVDEGIQKQALETIRSEIKSATASMTAVPKPLKFLRPLYPQLKDFFSKMQPSGNKVFMADVLSVLAMTMAEESSRESLHFKLQGSTDSPHSWGHEYVRHLCGEIGQEYTARMEKETDKDGMETTPDVSDIMKLVKEIVPFLMSSNAEPEACDLLMEVERLEMLEECADEKSFERVCLYLTSCANYVTEPEDMEILKCACSIYRKVNKYPQALRTALKIGDMELVRKIYDDCVDIIVKKQLAFDLARQSVFLDDDDEDNLHEIMKNCKQSEQFLSLAKDLDVLDPKVPEDVYKSHLLDARQSLASKDESARQNMAATFVNAFVNMGFGTDKLVLDDETRFMYRNKEHGIMSAFASLGMILLWDVDGGLTKIDKYMYSQDEHVKGGAYLAVGIVSAGVRADCDPALALLSEHVNSTSMPERCGAICGLGIAYAGTQNEAVLELLMPIVAEVTTNPDVLSLASLALGLVFVGSANGEIAASLIQAMSDHCDEAAAIDDVDLSHVMPMLLRLMPLAVGLLFLGKQETADAVAESIKAMVTGPLGNACLATLLACAYAGTGNVLKVQKLLAICGEHPAVRPWEDPDSLTPEQKLAREEINVAQSVAVLGIAMVAMGEELGSEMALRSYGHLLQYGEPPVRRGVPLALGLLSISQPQLAVVDTLSKLTHDKDPEVAQAAILGLGLVGAGTNNARIAVLLRQLSSFYIKDCPHLFVLRIAQGLLHAGKGLVTFNPMHSERLLLNPIALGGLLTVLFASLDMKGTIHHRFPYLLYFLSLSARPRMVYTVDEDLEPLAVNLRVGQAVDTVGQAGRPKTITGFQTHTAPVLLASGERAELATEEYLPVSAVLEGCVILKKNPDYVE